MWRGAGVRVLELWWAQLGVAGYAGSCGGMEGGVRSAGAGSSLERQALTDETGDGGAKANMETFYIQFRDNGQVTGRWVATKLEDNTSGYCLLF